MTGASLGQPAPRTHLERSEKNGSDQTPEKRPKTKRSGPFSSECSRTNTRHQDSLRRMEWVVFAPDIIVVPGSSSRLWPAGLVPGDCDGWCRVVAIMAQFQRRKRKALRLCQNGRFEAAESLLLRRLEREPDDVDIVRQPAVAIRLRAIFSTLAITSLAGANWSPRMSCPMRFSALNSFFLTHNWDAALVEAERVIELQPDNLAVIKGYITVFYLLTEQFAEAGSALACNRFLQGRPHEPSLLYLLARGLPFARKRTRSCLGTGRSAPSSVRLPQG